jgi:hypothetical protein
MMNASSSRSEGIQMPPWALPAVIVVGLLLLLFIGWRALAGPSNAAADNRKPLQVRPGMYNLQAEFAKGGAGRLQQGQQQQQLLLQQMSPAATDAGTR